MNICRSAPRLITTTPGDVYSLAVTPQTDKLVFSAGTSHNGALERDVFSVNTDGSELRQLTDRSELSWQAAVSPDGQEIAYVVEQAGRSNLFAMNLDGSNDRALTTSNRGFWEPLWAPEGKQVLTTSRDSKGGNLELVGVCADGGGQQQVSFMGGGSNQSATYSADGQQILFSSDIEMGRPQLYKMNRDGSQIEQLSQGVVFMGPATLSPQGTAVFTGVDPWNNWNLYQVRLDGSEPQRRLESAPNPSGVTFSPDGQQLVYASEGQIVLAYADGTHQQVLTSAEERFRLPVFAPNGESVFALASAPEGTAIYQIPLS